MINKFVVAPGLIARFIRENRISYIKANVRLARYETTSEEVQEAIENNHYEGEKGIVIRNFNNGWDLILNSTDKEADYEFLLELHRTLMADLIDTQRNELSEEQQTELRAMLNQPTKANTEVALDVMLYILDKRLFTDGDVRTSIMFANKILRDSGNGVIVVRTSRVPEFREMLHEYHETHSDDLKNWLYTHCILGVKNDKYN